MPTVVDSLTLTLGVDNSGLDKGVRDSMEAFKKIREEEAKLSIAVQESGKKVSETFLHIRNEALAFFGVLIGARGLKEFTSSLIATNLELSRFSANIGIAPQYLMAWGLAAERSGGSLEATAVSFGNLAKSLYELKNAGAGLPRELFLLENLGKSHVDWEHGPVKYMESLAKAIQAANKINPTDAYFYAKALGVDDGTYNAIIRGGKALMDLIAAKEKLVWSDKALKNAADMVDAFVDLRQELVSLTGTITEQAGPAVADLINYFDDLLKANKQDITQGIVGGVKEFSAWAKTIHWKDVGDEIHYVATEAGKVADALGGVVRISEVLLGMWVGSKALSFGNTILGGAVKLGGGLSWLGGGGTGAALASGATGLAAGGLGLMAPLLAWGSILSLGGSVAHPSDPGMQEEFNNDQREWGRTLSKKVIETVDWMKTWFKGGPVNWDSSQSEELSPEIKELRSREREYSALRSFHSMWTSATMFGRNPSSGMWDNPIGAGMLGRNPGMGFWDGSFNAADVTGLYGRNPAGGNYNSNFRGNDLTFDGRTISRGNPLPVMITGPNSSGPQSLWEWIFGKSSGGGEEANSPTTPGPHSGNRPIWKRWLGIGGSDSSDGGGGSPNSPGKWWTADRMKDAADYLVKNGGLTELGAAGLVARWAAIESPNHGPADVNSASGASGAGQWLGPRLEALKKLAGERGVDWTDFPTQLDHAINELNGGDADPRTAEAARILRDPNATAADIARAGDLFERAERPYAGQTPVQAVYDAIHNRGPVPSGDVFIGDSIAYGLAEAEHVPSSAVVGASPDLNYPGKPSVLAQINAMKPEQLSGKRIILSSGASNNIARAGALANELEALKSKGVDLANVRVMGVGDDPRFVGINAQLQKIATDYGATFVPLGATPGGVHPDSYDRVLRGIPGLRSPYIPTGAALSTITNNSPVTTSSRANSMHIGQMNINAPYASDSDGIAQGISKSLADYGFAALNDAGTF